MSSSNKRFDLLPQFSYNDGPLRCIAESLRLVDAALTGLRQASDQVERAQAHAASFATHSFAGSCSGLYRAPIMPNGDAEANYRDKHLSGNVDLAKADQEQHPGQGSDTESGAQGGR